MKKRILVSVDADGDKVYKVQKSSFVFFWTTTYKTNYLEHAMIKYNKLGHVTKPYVLEINE